MRAFIIRAFKGRVERLYTPTKDVKAEYVGMMKGGEYDTLELWSSDAGIIKRWRAKPVFTETKKVSKKEK